MSLVLLTHYFESSLFFTLFTKILSIMKTKLVLFFALSTFLFLTSCKKDSTLKPQITFGNNIAEGTANANGEYTLTGHISSQVSLAKVQLTKQGEVTPFLTDESTAKNKNEYDFSYLITGISSNTTIAMDVYDQNGNKTSGQFLIRK